MAAGIWKVKKKQGVVLNRFEIQLSRDEDYIRGSDEKELGLDRDFSARHVQLHAGPIVLREGCSL